MVLEFISLALSQVKMWLRFLPGPAKRCSGKAAGVRALARVQQSSSTDLSCSQSRGGLGPVLMGHSHTKSGKSGHRAAYAFGEHYL